MQTLSNALASSNAVSVAKGFQLAVKQNEANATPFANSFAQLCINAAKSGSQVQVVKSTSCFALSIVFLVSTGNVKAATTCASAFASTITSAGGCSEYVTIILQVFLSITINVLAPGQNVLFWN